MKTDYNNRSKWIDIARGIGTILVIFVHSTWLGVNNWILTFVIPLFFFLSGFTFSTSRPFTTLFIRKVKTLIVPYFCLGTLCFIFSVVTDIIQGSFVSFSTSVSYYYTCFIIQKRFTALWFITCLFCLELTAYFLLKYIKSYKVLFVISIIMLALGLYIETELPILPWNIDACPIAFSYFYLGYLLKRKYSLVSKYFTKNNLILIALTAFILSIILISINWQLSKSYLNMFARIYKLFYLTYPASLLGILLIICISLLLETFNVRILTYIGQYSISYYATHSIIMIPIAQTILHRIHFMRVQPTTFHNWVYSIVVTWLVLLLCTVFNMIVINTKFKFILGK